MIVVTIEQKQQTVYNVFAYGDGQYVSSIGVQEHQASGSYDELTTFLRDHVATDHQVATCIEFDGPEQLSVFEMATRLDALEHVAPKLVEIVGDAIYCITHVIDGVPRADQVAHAPPHDVMPDYLRIYWKTQGFDFTELIEDDYLSAIKILWNQEKYISSLKLACSLVDTLGYVEFGDAGNVFVKWLDTYCDFTPMGVTTVEFWELRNSLLHMSNLDSRRVQRGEVKRLIPVLHQADQEFPINPTQNEGYFHMSRFFAQVLPKGIVRWVRACTADNEKFLMFVKRYDLVVSESRMMRIEVDE